MRVYNSICLSADSGAGFGFGSANEITCGTDNEYALGSSVVPLIV